MDNSRQAPLLKPWEHKNTQIHIIGAGATGSKIFMALVSLGLTNITVYDFDNIESHNLANQAYMAHHIGIPKVDALRDLYSMKTGEEPPPEMKFINARIPHADHALSGIVFLLTDSMASRKEIAKHLIDNIDVEWVIETRMAATHGNVFSFDPCQLSGTKWLDTLTDDETTEVSPCGLPISICMTADGIAAYAVWELVHVLSKDTCGAEQTNLFFKPYITQAKSL
jgi:ThiF family